MSIRVLIFRVIQITGERADERTDRLMYVCHPSIFFSGNHNYELYVIIMEIVCYWDIEVG